MMNEHYFAMLSRVFFKQALSLFNFVNKQWIQSATRTIASVQDIWYSTSTGAHY